MKLNLNKPKFSLNLGLTILFLALFLGQLFLGYKYLYGSFVGKDVPEPEGRVVRVQLKSYQETIQYLQGLNNYEPETLVLPRNNPFR